MTFIKSASCDITWGANLGAEILIKFGINFSSKHKKEYIRVLVFDLIERSSHDMYLKFVLFKLT